MAGSVSLEPICQLSDAQQGVRIRLIVSTDNDVLPIVLITNRSTRQRLPTGAICDVRCNAMHVHFIHLIAPYCTTSYLCTGRLPQCAYKSQLLQQQCDVGGSDFCWDPPTPGPGPGRPTLFNSFFSGSQPTWKWTFLAFGEPD